METKNNIKIKYQKGRIRPLVMGSVILVAGLVLDKWWWQIGLLIIIVLVVEAFYRYKAYN